MYAKFRGTNTIEQETEQCHHFQLAPKGEVIGNNAKAIPQAITAPTMTVNTYQKGTSNHPLFIR